MKNKNCSYRGSTACHPNFARKSAYGQSASFARKGLNSERKCSSKGQVCKLHHKPFARGVHEHFMQRNLSIPKISRKIWPMDKVSLCRILRKIWVTDQKR